MTKVRVLLADDHPAIQARVRRELGEQFEIIGIAENGEEAVAAVSRLDPDVLVIDISMPVLNGLDASVRLHAACCRTKIVILTIHDDPDFVAAAFSSGASAYVLKYRLSVDLALAIHEVLAGHTFISQSTNE